MGEKEEGEKAGKEEMEEGEEQEEKEWMRTKVIFKCHHNLHSIKAVHAQVSDEMGL